MATKYATDALFIAASQLGEVATLDDELAQIIQMDDPQRVENIPVQSEEGKTPVAPELRPWFRRYALQVANPNEDPEAVAIEPEKPYWRLVTFAAPVLPAAVELAYDHLFRDPDVITLATNLIRIPVGPAQTLWARLAPGAQQNILLSIVVDPWVGRRQ